MVAYLPVTKGRLIEIRDATENDVPLQHLKTIILQGWPSERAEVNPCVAPYFSMRDELTDQDGIIFRGERLVIPQKLRSDIKRRLHSSHIGINGSLRRARESIFWPGMSGDIKQYISTCKICCQYDVSQQKEALMSHDIPTRPREKVGVDLFEIEKHDYLVTVDYYSNFWEIDRLYTTTSKSIIQKLKSHFARNGIPNEVVSDNGPQFSCAEFAAFAKCWDFEHVPSSPGNSKANGKAESAVKSATKEQLMAMKISI